MGSQPTTGPEAPPSATAPTSGDDGSGLFLRKATGLVREISVWDAFNINLTNANAWSNIAVLLPLGLALFVGANLWLSVALGLVGGLFVILVYAMLAEAMPRSGGDYVFISRALHPFIGFLGSWTMAALCAFFIAFNAWAMANWVLPDFFGVLGTLVNAHWMLTLAADLAKKWVVIGLELVQFATWVTFMLRGAKSAARTQWVPVFFTIAATVVAIPVLLFTSRHTYLHNFNSFASHFHTSAAGMEAAAVKGGANLHPRFSWSETIAFWPFVMVIFGYALNSIQIGGEVRNPRKSQFVAPIAATLIAGGILTLFMAVGVSRVPSALMHAAGYFTYTNGSANPFPFTLYAQVPLALGTTNPVLIILMSGAIACGLWGSSLGLYLWSTRYLLAWSLDQVAPPQVAALHGRRNVPIVAIGIITAAAIGFGFLLEYDSAISFVSGSLLQACLLLFASIAGIVFPYRLRDLYRAGAVRSVFGVPLVSVIGVVATAFMGVTVYFYATNATFGTVTGSSLIFSVVVLALGTVYYLAAWLIARSRGVDLGFTYRVLPPE